MEKATVLVVDDDREIVKAITLLLQSDDIQCVPAYDGMQALQVVSSQPVHVMILDIMMPKLDGLSVTMKIRAEKNIPILLLSAKSEQSDKVLGLSMGADDYVTKPFHPPELVARVRSLLRRYTQLGGLHGGNAGNLLQSGGLQFDIEARALTVDGVPVHLTATEVKLVELLMRNVGRVFPAEEIYERVWDVPAFAAENTVMVHIRRIREKIEANPKEPKYLKVVWGIGYKIEKF